jgi:hypothetical protein
MLPPVTFATAVTVLTTDTTSDLEIATSQQSCYYCTWSKYIATSDVACGRH